MTRRSPSVLWPTAQCLCLPTTAVTQPCCADVSPRGRQEWDQCTFSDTTLAVRRQVALVLALGAADTALTTPTLVACVGLWRRR